jgi:hypothetical protein
MPGPSPLLYRLRLRLRSLFRRGDVERDLHDEFAFHLAMQAEVNRTAGGCHRAVLRRAPVRHTPLRSGHNPSGGNRSGCSSPDCRLCARAQGGTPGPDAGAAIGMSMAS